MKSSRSLFLSIAILLLCSLSALAQAAGGDAKHFNKDGLLFDYPAAWAIEDQSNANAQQLTLARPDSDAQIRLFVNRNRATTAENVAEAKRVLVDPYLNTTAKAFEQMGARPERLPVSTDISGAKSEGVRIQAALDGEPGAAEVYWAVIGQRLIVLTFLGPDKGRNQAAGAWDMIRNSLKIEEPQPSAKPSPE